MDSVRSLEAPEYTEEEREALIDFVLALKKTHVQDFFKRVGLQTSGTKDELREGLQEALEEGEGNLTYA